MPNLKYVAALDVGTTTLRCIIYNSNLEICGYADDQIDLIYPQPGFAEIEPDKLWNSVLKAMRNAIADAHLEASEIASLGIATQRSTFITWDRVTNETFHNFITWKDLRADDLVHKWNSSFAMKTIRNASKFLYLVTRQKRFLAGSVLKITNSHVTLRLAWTLQNNAALQHAIASGTALFGTLDSWLLYKFRQGTNSTKYVEHISDISSCTATGFFDPFTLGWAEWALHLFSIKSSILPKVVDNNYDFGCTDRSLFGSEIKIGCSMADQSASMWGSCCFNRGDCKVTLGTGSFLNVNTGNECPASANGLYPLVSWRYTDQTNKQDLGYCIEGASNDTGTIIKWAIDFGLFKEPSVSSDIADSVADSDGVYFIPAFSGLGHVKSVLWTRKKSSAQYWKKPPINDYQAASGILGLRPTTANAHMVRAVLESLVFRVTQLYFCILKETDFEFKVIRVDGGVSKNNFVCQMLADLTGLNVERSRHAELTALGVAFFAGLNANVWSSREEMLKMRQIDRVFKPQLEIRDTYIERMKSWERALDRFRGWYNHQEMVNLEKTMTSRL